MSNEPPFKKILVANRGEIAVRILRACREMGVQSVAVFSEADKNSMHVQLADEAVLIGPPPAARSYLQIDSILKAAWQTGAQAIHPGYGFLSENSRFAEAVQAADLTFIGPDPEAIRQMGDKATARAIMENAGVPIIPGYQGLDSDADLLEAALQIGYPLLVKAAAGGGGKGMRVVTTSEELPEALNAARREAAKAFDDSRLILERYISRARHIEFQILADQHGQTFNLHERECSIQRRHQKIIEETPSPLLNPEMRAEMGKAAVAAAEAVGYTSAGTVEFIVDPDSKIFYFLEMNTRLQVEHPITELVTGVDLVQWQIRIAAGEAIDWLTDPKRPTPDGLQPSEYLRPATGHAIECRLYAEDPANGFLPATGPMLLFSTPVGPGIRIDSGVQTGDEISTYYDPLIAKIIVHAANRELAVRKMKIALQDTLVLGLTTNLEFLRSILDQAAFRNGEATTRFVEQEMGDWGAERDLPLTVLVAAAISADRTSHEQVPGSEPDPYSPWKRLTNFRLGS